MSPFEIRPLGDVAALQAGVGFPLDLQGRSAGKYPLAKVGDISRGGRSGFAILDSADHFVDDDDLPRLRTKPIPRGSTLFAKIGEAIRQNHRVIAGREMLVDNNAMAAIPRPGTVSEYLYHFLRTVDFYGLASTTTVPSLRKSDLERIPVPFPSQSEQRRIAEVLDRADALRAKRRAALAQVDTLAQYIFLDLFGDPALNPKKWPKRAVGDIAAKFSDGPFGSNVKSSHYAESGVRVVRLQNIGVGEFVDKDKAFIDEAHFGSLKKHECRPGDLLIGTLGDPNLRACIQPEWLSVAINKADCVQFRADASQVTPEYVCALLNTPATERMAHDLVQGQTRLRISMGRLRGLDVPVPPLRLQKEFSLRLGVVEKVKSAQRRSITELDTLFASLQHRAFRGEL